jgi:hypothetical protein
MVHEIISKEVAAVKSVLHAAREYVHPAIEWEVAATKGALHKMREWVHPTTVMKQHAFDRPLDDLGQTIDVEGQLHDD